MDWLLWLLAGVILILWVIPIGHGVYRRFGYRCPRCREHARFSGRSINGYMHPATNSFTCQSCGKVFWEVFGRLQE